MELLLKEEILSLLENKNILLMNFDLREGCFFRIKADFESKSIAHLGDRYFGGQISL